MHRSYGTIHWPYDTDLCQKYNQSKDDRSTCSTRHFHTSAYIPSQTIWEITESIVGWHLDHDLHKMKQVFWHNTSNKNSNWHRWLRTCLAEAIPHCHEALWLGKEWNKQTPWCTSDLQQPFQLVSTYYSGNQRKWWEMPSHWSQGFEQSHMEVCVAHAKVWRDFSKLNGAKYFSTLNLWAWYHHIPLDEDSILKQLLHLLLEIWVPEGSFWTGTSSSILWRTQE